MPVVGLGTDIVEVERIESALARSGQRFAERILTAVEMERFLQTSQQARFLAKRFAAKEAAAKALGTGIAAGVSFQNMHIGNNAAGKPELTLTGAALAQAERLGGTHWLLSISDERHFAVATVLIEA
ncbi:holo-ACP synthase [Corallincola holothuriorum]|uniref:Holo-[acyl-carrier-protein] synthase n=1 Tax=Corallincola holothuriorum TaxID=2282215 RepID=A0A368NPN4_9GAMM|nr:holo-ACP synthase [Corallincola holothuriorum]RCU51863.1 holo-ACP synthase [Corallincola holothuriorum]